MGRKKEMKRPPPLVLGSPIGVSTSDATASSDEGNWAPGMNDALLLQAKDGVTYLWETICFWWRQRCGATRRRNPGDSGLMPRRETTGGKESRLHRDPPPSSSSSSKSGALVLIRQVGVQLAVACWWILSQLWTLVCVIGRLLSRCFVMLSHHSADYKPSSSVVEDGEIAEGLNPGSRSGSSTTLTVHNGGESAEKGNKRRGHLREDSDTGFVPHHSRCGSTSYYYDVEEGQFQPSQRLFFRRVGTETSLSALDGTSLVNMLPSPVTIGSKMYQTAAGIVPAAGGEEHRSTSLHPHSPVTSTTTSAQDVLDGYYAAKYGERVGNGAFQIVSCIGRGTYSSVWLAMDVRGVTASIMPNMLHRMEDNSSGYNSSASILSGGSLQHTFVVLKVSRSRPAFVQACEGEFATNRMLLLDLQRHGFPLDRFLLYPSSFLQPSNSANGKGSKHTKGSSTLLHPAPPGGGKGERRKSPVAATSHRGPPAPPPSNADAMHVVQVGDLCGPSLLLVITDAAPHRCGTNADRLWRLDAIRCMVRQLIEGLMQLHACSVVHSDIKVENVLFSLPAVEFLEKMRCEERSGFLTTSQRHRMQQNIALARHRIGLICHQGTWKELVSRQRDLGDGGLEEVDATRIVCMIKVADLGSSIKCTSGSSNATGAGGGGGRSHGVSPSKSTLPRSGALSNCSSTGMFSVSSSQSSSFACASEATTPSRGAAAMHLLQPLQAPTAEPWSARLLQTREYRSPEVLVQLHPSVMVSPALDVWSAACMAFELVTGHYLFHPRMFASAEAQKSNDEPPQAVGGDVEADVDAVHLKMIEELLCETVPWEIQRCGLHSKRFYPNSSDVSPPAPPASASDLDAAKEEREVHQKKHQFLVALLRHHLLSPSPGDSSAGGHGKDHANGALLASEIDELADFLAAMLQWLPWRRPSAREVLRHAWLQRGAF